MGNGFGSVMIFAWIIDKALRNFDKFSMDSIAMILMSIIIVRLIKIFMIGGVECCRILRFYHFSISCTTIYTILHLISQYLILIKSLLEIRVKF